MLRSIMHAQGSAVPAATLLQTDRLQMLEGMLGRPRLESLLRQLAGRATQDLNGIVEALEAGDGARASGLAHGLKGAAGMLGASRLAVAAEALRDAADHGRSPIPALEDLRRAVADTLLHLPPPDREAPT